MFARSRGLVGDGPGAAAPSRRDGMGWEDRGREGCLGKGRFPSRVRG